MEGQLTFLTAEYMGLLMMFFASKSFSLSVNNATAVIRYLTDNANLMFAKEELTSNLSMYNKSTYLRRIHNMLLNCQYIEQVWSRLET
jgi:hypothetical protein